MELNLVKVASGEHLLGEVVDNNGHITLKNVCVVYPKDDNDIGVVPIYNMFKDGEVVLNKDMVIYSGFPNDEIFEQFEAAFGTKLIMPQTSIIKGV
jgi:hypothetical protein